MHRRGSGVGWPGVSGPWAEDNAGAVTPAPPSAGDAGRWPGPPFDPPKPPDGGPVPVRLPADAEGAVVVGPGDLLVIRVRATVSAADLDGVRATIEAGPLRGRVLLVAAEQIGVVRA